MDTFARHCQPLGISASLHFLVDALCCCCMLLLAKSSGCNALLGVYLTYNVVAFMTQPLTGMVADRLHRRHWLLMAASLLLALAVLTAALIVAFGWNRLSPDMLYVVAVLLGGGNSLFHVWGGKQVAVGTDNDIRALGVFVSTGAFGLSVGALCCSWPVLFAFLLLIPLLSVAYLHVEPSYSTAADASHSTAADAPHTTAADAPHPTAADASQTKPAYSPVAVWTAVVAVAAVVLFRSFIGEKLTTGIDKTQLLILLFGAVSMAGKMAGGWIALRLGIVRALVVVLVAFALCFLLRDTSVAVVLAGLFLINCTMPVTLYWANALLPGREGFAFGLLAAVLVPGYLLAVL